MSGRLHIEILQIEILARTAIAVTSFLEANECTFDTTHTFAQDLPNNLKIHFNNNNFMIGKKHPHFSFLSFIIHNI